MNNPANLIVTSATRTWNDANRDYIPQESQLGPLSSTAFGQVVRRTTYVDEVLHGNRQYNWQASVQLQHELVSDIALNVGYFRTWYGNFRVTDNLPVTPADFSHYCITAPTDPLLPGDGGNQICGLYDINPAAFGRTNNLVTLASHYGKQTDVFNGVDVTVSARFGQGGVIQGGVATGSEVTDRCFVVDSPQELYQCRVSPPWSAGTQVKVSVVYPLPWALQASAIYQNSPPIPTTASLVATNAQIAPSLGRNLGACGTQTPCNFTAIVELITANTFYQEPRINQLDLRLSRTFRLAGRARVQPQLDIFNITNANPVLTMITRYGPAWRRATAVLAPRVFRFGVNVNF